MDYLSSSVLMLVHCVVKYSRPPDLKSSSNFRLPFAWITGHATHPSTSLVKMMVVNTTTKKRRNLAPPFQQWSGLVQRKITEDNWQPNFIKITKSALNCYINEVRLYYVYQIHNFSYCLHSQKYRLGSLAVQKSKNYF